jgi:hypothetical protein
MRSLRRAASGLSVEGVDGAGATFAYSANGDFNGKDYPFVGAGTRNGGDTVSWKPIDAFTIDAIVKKAGSVVNATRERNGSEWTRDTWSQSLQEAIKGLAHLPSNMRCTSRPAANRGPQF